MNRLLSWVGAVIGCAIVVIAAAGDAWAERRVALVVGNSNYKIANISLSNPRNDAQDISAVLKSLGFEVMTVLDISKRDMDFALQNFARLATDADSALFYYAGHAMQFQGRNYLLPTDAELEDDISVRYQTVAIDEVRAALDRANGVKIMILDACRNNPVADSLQRRLAGGASRSVATTRGLARIDKTQGMVIAYATAADDVAQDGQGRNSPFTAALLRRLQEPGLEIEMMFRRVAFDVNAQTGGRQHPETSISLLSEYYLNQSDRIVWDRIKDQDDANALRDFINKYPSSPHAIFARNRLDLLERYAKEREEIARRAREDEQRKAAEADAQRIAREAQARREAEERQRVDQIAAQKRIEDEQKRQEALRQDALRQQAEQKRLEDEQKRLAAAQQAAEQKRIEDEQKRLAAVQQTAEQKRIEDEQRRLADQQRQQQQVDLERKRIEETCRREEAKLAQLQATGGADAREQLVKFEIEVSCKALRPMITAAIASLPEAPPPVAAVPVEVAVVAVPPVAAPPIAAPPIAVPPSSNIDIPAPNPAEPVNTVDQVRKAQVALKRIGCYFGRTDGKLNEATQDAVKSYGSHTGRAIVEISITEELLSDIEQHEERVCKPGRAKSEPAPVASRPPSRPAAHEPARQEAQRPAPAPAAKATAATSPSSSFHAIGTGF